jgi:hypothetical protein
MLKKERNQLHAVPHRRVGDRRASELFPIHDVASAARGIDIIVQGEGTSQNSLEADEQPAHYYRFAEIFYGKRLVPDATVPEKFSYAGALIPFDASGGLGHGGHQSEGTELSDREQRVHTPSASTASTPTY